MDEVLAQPIASLYQEEPAASAMLPWHTLNQLFSFATTSSSTYGVN